MVMIEPEATPSLVTIDYQELLDGSVDLNGKIERVRGAWVSISPTPLHSRTKSVPGSDVLVPVSLRHLLLLRHTGKGPSAYSRCLEFRSS